jgi:hypothetical protein
MQTSETFMGDLVGVGIIGGAQGVVVTAADPVWSKSAGAAHMTPGEARAFAARLIEIADACDEQRSTQNLPAFPAKTAPLRWTE